MTTPASTGLTPEDWDDLIDAIEDRRCTPFIGAGACIPLLKSGGEYAKDLSAVAPVYPLSKGGEDLMQVAQHKAIMRSPQFPKRWVTEEIKKTLETAYPDFERHDQPHGVLARLPFSLYLTTNYDDIMEQALHHKHRRYHSERWRWEGITNNGTPIDCCPALVRPPECVCPPGYIPSLDEPLVFHLHGCMRNPQFIVLTEDDYVDSLVKLGQPAVLTAATHTESIPPVVGAAIVSTSLLLIGYSLGDWNFRVVFRSIMKNLASNYQFPGVTIQLDPRERGGDPKSAEYLEQYFLQYHLKVYWGTAQHFVETLWEKWLARHPESAPLQREAAHNEP